MTDEEIENGYYDADASEYETLSMRLWRLNEELSVYEATILMLGLDPQRVGNVDDDDSSCQPNGYAAVRGAIIRALAADKISGHAHYPAWEKQDAIDPALDMDIHLSRVNVESLTAWLRLRGWRHGFFFPQQGSTEPYLDIHHPRYAPKLHAAIVAWENVGKQTDVPGSVKSRIMTWLTSRAANYGLADKDGAPNQRGIEEVAKVANWEPGGGAPKTLNQGKAKGDAGLDANSATPF